MSVAITHSFDSTDDQLGKVIVRTTALDPFQGLKGHAYIQARNLDKPVRRVQTSAHAVTGKREME